jgi:HlyD family secretion protein
MRRATPWIGLSGIIVLLGFGFWLVRRGPDARAADTQAPAAGPAPSPSGTTRDVEVVTVQRTTMARSLEFPATIEAFEEAELYAKTSGYLSEVRVDIGDRIRAGQQLAVIDVPELGSEFDQASAVLASKHASLEAIKTKVMTSDSNIESARNEQLEREAEVELQGITVQRKEELLKGQAIPQQEFDEARIRLDIAKARVNVAKATFNRAQGDKRVAQAEQVVAEADVEVAEASVSRVRTFLGYTQIRAPFDGVITRRLVDRGALVQAGTGNRTTPLFTIQRIDQLRIFIEVPESEVSHVRRGVSAKVKPYGLPGTVVPGDVTRAASALNSSTRTMRTEIDVSNADGRLMSGMYAQVTLELDQHTNVLAIPASARLVEGKESYVLTIRDDRTVRTPIKVGLEDGTRVEAVEGLYEGAMVVFSAKGMNAGMAVRAVPKSTNP